MTFSEVSNWHKPCAFFIIVILFFLARVPMPSAGILNMNEKEEVDVGKQAAEMLASQYGLVQDKKQIERVTQIGDSLIAVCERPKLEYNFQILNTDMVNALALPGGYIFVTRGLLEMVDNDDELASVLAHELVHIALKHGVVTYKKGMQNMMYSLILILLARDPAAIMATSMVSEARMETYGRKAELEADRVGLQYMLKTGYDPIAFLRFLDKMQVLELRRPNLLEDYFEEHPPSDERIKIVEDEAGKLGIDPMTERGYKIQARVVAEEVCDKEGRCCGVLRGGTVEIMRLGDKDGFPTPYDRAREVESRVNNVLSGNIKMYEISVRSTDKHVFVWAYGKPIVEVLDGDAELARMTQQDLAAQWANNLKYLLWKDFVKERM